MDYTPSYPRKWNPSHELWIGKDLEGNNYVVIEVLSWHLPGETEENIIINIKLYKNYKIENELYSVGVTMPSQCFRNTFTWRSHMSPISAVVQNPGWLLSEKNPRYRRDLSTPIQGLHSHLGSSYSDAATTPPPCQPCPSAYPRSPPPRPCNSCRSLRTCRSLQLCTIYWQRLLFCSNSLNFIVSWRWTLF
jgi:hypothetical protein